MGLRAQDYRGPYPEAAARTRAAQKQVAQDLDVTEFSIINWEQGDWQPSNVFTLHRIVKFLGYDPFLRDQLRGKRREMSWGQRELAAHLGVDGKTITHWEHGGTILRRSHRVAVARFLGIEEEQFVAQMGSRWSASHGKQSA